MNHHAHDLHMLGPSGSALIHADRYVATGEPVLKSMSVPPHGSPAAFSYPPIHRLFKPWLEPTEANAEKMMQKTGCMGQRMVVVLMFTSSHDIQLTIAYHAFG